MIRTAAAITLSLTAACTKRDSEPTALQPTPLPPDCSPPSPVTQVLPEYRAEHVHLAGRYVFRVVVAADGHAESIDVFQAPNREWAESSAEVDVEARDV